MKALNTKLLIAIAVVAVLFGVGISLLSPKSVNFSVKADAVAEIVFQQYPNYTDTFSLTEPSDIQTVADAVSALAPKLSKNASFDTAEALYVLSFVDKEAGEATVMTLLPDDVFLLSVGEEYNVFTADCSALFEVLDTICAANAPQ